MRRAFRGKFSVRKRNFFPLFFWSTISSFITFPFRPGSIPFFRNSSFHYITPSCDSQSYPSPLNPFHMFTFYHSLSLYPSSLYPFHMFSFIIPFPFTPPHYTPFICSLFITTFPFITPPSQRRKSSLRTFSQTLFEKTWYKMRIRTSNIILRNFL